MARRLVKRPLDASMCRPSPRSRTGRETWRRMCCTGAARWPRPVWPGWRAAWPGRRLRLQQACRRCSGGVPRSLGRPRSAGQARAVGQGVGVAERELGRVLGTQAPERSASQERGFQAAHFLAFLYSHRRSFDHELAGSASGAPKAVGSSFCTC